jgi:hypothetical protein
LVVQLSFYYLFGGLNDEPRSIFIEHPEISVCLRRSPLDEPERPNEWATEPISTDWEIKHCSLGRRAIQRIGGHFHSAHGIFFGSCFHSWDELLIRLHLKK